MDKDTMQTRTIQTWPGGASFEFRGDPDGPAEQRRLRAGYARGTRWRKGTPEEWRAIRIALFAERYADREIWHCDSSLVDDLLRAASSGECHGDLADAFGDDAIRNLYTDPSGFDAAECREYAEDHGIDLPDVPEITCGACKGAGEIVTPFGDPDRDEERADPCETCNGSGSVPDPDYAEDDSARGWLTETRDACREYAQENPAEVYEWWRVSPWLCRQLHDLGYVTIDNNYGEWYGRTCTGQGFIMDGVLQRIAAQYVK